MHIQTTHYSTNMACKVSFCSSFPPFSLHLYASAHITFQFFQASLFIHFMPSHSNPSLWPTPLNTTLKYTLLYSTLLYSTLLYSPLLYSTLLYSPLLSSALLYSTLLYSTLLYSTLLYSLSFKEYSMQYTCSGCS